MRYYLRKLLNYIGSFEKVDLFSKWLVRNPWCLLLLSIGVLCIELGELYLNWKNYSHVPKNFQVSTTYYLKELSNYIDSFRIQIDFLSDFLFRNMWVILPTTILVIGCTEVYSNWENYQYDYNETLKHNEWQRRKFEDFKGIEQNACIDYRLKWEEKPQPPLHQRKISKFFNTNQLCIDFFPEVPFPEAPAPKYHQVLEPTNLDDNEIIQRLKRADERDKINEENLILESEEAINRVKKNYKNWYYPESTVKWTAGAGIATIYIYLIKVLLS
jgi:hypothetical protein